MPCVLSTGCLGFYASIAVVDGEVEGYHTVAACGIMLSVGGGVGGSSVGGKGEDGGAE